MTVHHVKMERLADARASGEAGRLAGAREASARWSGAAGRTAAALGLRFGRVTFALIVVIPTVLAVLYFGFIAADQYVAEARFAVRQPQARKTEGTLEALKALLRGKDTGARDVFVVANYIRSRNIVQEIDADGKLRQMFARPEADLVARFDPAASAEQLWKYWLGKVYANVDVISGIITVRAIAFRPEDALTIAEEVTRRSEKLVNDYSSRLREDAVRTAELEIEQAAARFRKVLVELREFRDADRVVDPIRAATATATMLLQIQLERIVLERERSVTAVLTSPQSPATQLLAERVKALDQQIARLQKQLAVEHEGIKTASATLAQYEELELARVFAERLLAVTMTAFERARAEAERQQVYLIVFLRPSLPEGARLPRRYINTGLVLVCSLVIWGALWLVVAGVRDQMT